MKIVGIPHSQKKRRALLLRLGYTTTGWGNAWWITKREARELVEACLAGDQDEKLLNFFWDKDVIEQHRLSVLATLHQFGVTVS